MSALTPYEISQLAMRMTGELSLAPDAEYPEGRTVIIQGATEDTCNARSPSGKPIIIYDKPVQTYSRTPAQSLRRDILADAHTYFLSLTTDEKEGYANPAKERQITRYNAAISAWMNAHTDRTQSRWDDNMSPWDGGTSIWRSEWDAGTTQFDDKMSQWLE